jgi:hypothetical protein
MQGSLYYITSLSINSPAAPRVEMDPPQETSGTDIGHLVPEHVHEIVDAEVHEALDIEDHEAVNTEDHEAVDTEDHEAVDTEDHEAVDIEDLVSCLSGPARSVDDGSVGSSLIALRFGLSEPNLVERADVHIQEDSRGQLYLFIHTSCPSFQLGRGHQT